MFLVQTAGGSAGISRVQIKSSSTSTYVDMQNAWGASWQISSAPSYPVDVIITSDDGSQVTLPSLHSRLSMSIPADTFLHYMIIAWVVLCVWKLEP